MGRGRVAIPHGHFQVHQHAAKWTLRKQSQRLLAVVRHLNLDLDVLQQLNRHLLVDRLVFNQQDASALNRCQRAAINHTARAVGEIAAIAGRIRWYYNFYELVIPAVDMNTLTLKIPDALDAALQLASARRHLTKSAVVRKALEKELADELSQTTPAANWLGQWRGAFAGQAIDPAENTVALTASDARVAHILRKHLS